MEFNKYQSTLEELKLESYPEEVQQEFMEYISSVPYIRNLISPTRPYVQDLPKDENGRAIIDISNPPILTNTHYFTPVADYYRKYGVVTHLRPNSNPNSEYGRWLKEEVRRCWDGYVRPDGAWITGSMYFYLNYAPIILSKRRKNSKVSDRVVDFPSFWEGIWWRYLYWDLARRNAKHCAEIAKRGAGKSYSISGELDRMFLLGDNSVSNTNLRGVVIAYQKEYLTKDGTLTKFIDMINFAAANTQFPALRLKESLQELTWTSGYKDVNTGIIKGSQNTILGVSAKDDIDKVRGKRATKIFIEEFGNFPRVVDMYRVLLPSVQDGDDVFGQINMLGTGGSEGADFAGAYEIIYNPDGYYIQSVPNVYDKAAQGKGNTIFFFGAPINRKGCYDEDGISDVTKAILQLCYDRYIVKYNTTDPMALTRTKAENPITLQEAIMRRDNSIFPVSALIERIDEIKSNLSFFDDVYVGDLVMKKDGKVEFVPTTKTPIRFFPHKDNNLEGAIEIFKMPEKDKNGKVFNDRYIASSDPFDDDSSETLSLGSTFILDLWTDTIVAEYTGRSSFADDYYEKTRLLCLFFNARLNYEAHPYTQVVLTPNGEKLWGDIKVGDKLFAPDGKEVSVIDIPMDGKDDIYKITFADGRIVEASSNHIWPTYKNGNTKDRYTLKNRTTKELFDSQLINKFNQKMFYIPESGAVEYSYKEIPIDPYTMGLLIAEGAFTKFKKNKYENFKRRIVQMSSSKEDMEFYKTKIPYETKYIGTKGYSWHIYIDNIDKKLEELNLLFTNSHTKFIPEVYLYNSYNVRMELLKGLMDGDGCAIKSQASVFVTVSKQLAKDIKTLCRGLGIKCWDSNVDKHYRINIAAEVPIFNLPRKIERQHIYNSKAKGSKSSGALHRNAIVNIEYVGKKRCKCVTVDSEDGLYLIGDYIVTHNCNKKGLFAYFNKMNCLYILFDTFSYLRDRDLIKGEAIGNKAKGVNATLPINNYARTLIRDWLIRPFTKIETVNGEEHEVTIMNLQRIKNLALLLELSQWNPDGNYDRVSSLGMLMIAREDRMITYGGDIEKAKNRDDSKDLSNDDFFKVNYDERFKAIKREI